MNKIVIEGLQNKIKNIEILEDSIIIIKDSIARITCNLIKNVNAFLYLDNSNLELEYNIKSDTNLNIFTVNTSLKVDLNLQKDDLSINYSYSTLNQNDNVYKININHLAKNTKSKIINRGINLQSNKLSFEVNTFVPKTSIGTQTTQDSKIILLGEKTGTIKPNLFVDTEDIEANHAAYIGNFKKDEIFYLETRGIDRKTAKVLLAKSFLIGGMTNISFREKDIILEKIKKYWR